ncbi:MAG: class I SAM-dependent methyltransferase [Cyclobacteriaceae bacterium]|nr:class I SAM-dependent methyltransferase [Cyclobacteriaceae bacterium]
MAQDGWATVAVEPDKSPVVGAGAIRSLNHRRIKVIEGFGESLPFSGDTFDVVVARAVLHHSRDLSQLCREVARVMKKGSVFLAMREHVISREKDLPIFLEQHPLHSLYGGENAFTLNRYRSAFQQAGLKLLQTYGPACSDINVHPLTRQRLAVQRKKKLCHFACTKQNDQIGLLLRR